MTSANQPSMCALSELAQEQLQGALLFVRKRSSNGSSKSLSITVSVTQGLRARPAGVAGIEPFDSAALSCSLCKLNSSCRHRMHHAPAPSARDSRLCARIGEDASCVERVQPFPSSKRQSSGGEAATRTGGSCFFVGLHQFLIEPRLRRC